MKTLCERCTNFFVKDGMTKTCPNESCQQELFELQIGLREVKRKAYELRELERSMSINPFGGMHGISKSKNWNYTLSLKKCVKCNSAFKSKHDKHVHCSRECANRRRSTGYYPTKEYTQILDAYKSGASFDKLAELFPEKYSHAEKRKVFNMYIKTGILPINRRDLTYKKK